MIEVIKLDGARAMINLDNINMVEKTPDTLITFKDGQKIYVKDSLDELRTKINNYRNNITNQDQADPWI